MLQGSCQCQRVKFSLSEQPREVIACHCVQCRKQSSHYFVSANVSKAAVELQGAEHIRWYQASDKVRRGFCMHCGSWLFWEPLAGDTTAVGLGSIDGPTGLALEMHIFVAEKGDYYAICDGLPQNEH
jgi:hypothetical protein